MIRVRIKNLDAEVRRKYLLAEAVTRLTPAIVRGIAEQIAIGIIRAQLRKYGVEAEVTVEPDPIDPEKKPMRLFKPLLVTVLVLIVALLSFIKVRYGSGTPGFPDRTGTPLLAESVLEVVAELPTPPGNIAVAPDGRVFVSLHPEAKPQLKIVELIGGAMKPYPNIAFQTGEGEARYFRDVLSLRIDRQNRLWTLDNGFHGTQPGRLLAFDLASGAVVHEFVFPRTIAGIGSHLNDFQVSADGQFIYIAEASIFGLTPALIVYDVAQQKARRLLEEHASVLPESWVPVVQGVVMKPFGLFSIRPGVDSIALSRDGQWLYFAAVNASHLYRIRSADLRNEALSAAELASKVETYADKTMSDGLSSDDAGNVILSDPEHSAVVLLKPDRTLHTLIKTEKLRWPDGFSFGPEGWLYVTGSSLHHVIGKPPSSVVTHAPYPVFRFRPGTVGTPGH